MTASPAMPGPTYRLQLHAGFGFSEARAIVPYLARLGIAQLYLSPILAARHGSTHGYDVVDPTRVSDALGGEDGLRSLAAAARAAGLGILLDIVPNHMATGPENSWWQDVLARGPGSPWAHVFDIDWEAEDPALKGRILCPFLDRPYGEALAAGLLVLGPCADHGWVVHHQDTPFPIRPEDHAELDAAPPGAFDPGRDESRQRLHRLLERQHYRLAWWRTAGDEINWRRFFDIGELVSVRAEDERVFDLTHATILRLYGEGLVDGLRIDHVDGLADPAGYCRRLRAALDTASPQRPADAPSGPAWLLVEKIVAEGEALPSDWGVDGTTGYDFMDEVGSVLHDPAAAEPLGRAWAELSGRPAEFETEERAARAEMLERSFAAQLDQTTLALHRIARQDPATRDWSRAAIRRSLRALLLHFPAYRTYADASGRTAADAETYGRAARAAASELVPADRAALKQIGRWLGGEPAAPAIAEHVRIAIRRFQQLTAPLAAKSVEDTAFYRHGRLLSRNEVGSTPARFARSAAEFHAAQQRRGAGFPGGMLATATHDHKRGEDVRARLSVLSAIPQEWHAALRSWLPPAGTIAAGDAAMLCQMLVGAWPLDLDPDDGAGVDAFVGRLAAWQRKALREAKLRTDWTLPDESYEAAAPAYLTKLLGDEARRREIAAFVDRIAPAGAAAGLAQLVLRLTAPGVPDTYQGTEFWDFSLVDPDNRRPVDYAARSAALDAGTSPRDLLSAWRDGRIKQAILARLLAARRRWPALFHRGGYAPLRVPESAGILAFVRAWQSQRLAVVVPVRPRPGGTADRLPATPAGCDATLPLPSCTGGWFDLLGERPVAVDAAGIPANRLLDPLPVAVLVAGASGG